MSAINPVLALIPARGGSKGVPGKNLRDLCGKPLVAWTIECARAARGIRDIVVSTDSAEIADVARNWGSEVPFLRPAIHATDTATSMAVIEHALEWLAAHGRSYQAVVLLEPTSPLREPSDVEAALTLLEDAQTVVSVCRAETIHPAFMYRRTADGRLTAFLEGECRAPRRQDTEDLYFLEGTVYASRLETLTAQKSFYHPGTISYVVPKWKSPEIDDELDLVVVEAIMRHRGFAP
jgi:CMP-N,N'-diacetyllegionaminic acid synthase